MIQLIVKEVRKLKDRPRIGKMIPEAQEDQYRELRVFSFRVLYRIISEDRIVVIGVVHGQRLLDPEWLK